MSPILMEIDNAICGSHLVKSPLRKIDHFCSLGLFGVLFLTERRSWADKNSDFNCGEMMTFRGRADALNLCKHGGQIYLVQCGWCLLWTGGHAGDIHNMIMKKNYQDDHLQFHTVLLLSSVSLNFKKIRIRLCIMYSTLCTTNISYINQKTTHRVFRITTQFLNCHWEIF